jgi:hypothetical protein
VIVVAAVAVLGATGCGDDDDTADLSYCDALAMLAGEGAAIGPEADADAVASALDVWEQVARTAPAEAGDAARAMADAAAVISEDGSDADLDLDAIARASALLVASAAQTCDIDLMSGEGS